MHKMSERNSSSALAFHEEAGILEKEVPTVDRKLSGFHVCYLKAGTIFKFLILPQCGSALKSDMLISLRKKNILMDLTG